MSFKNNLKLLLSTQNVLIYILNSEEERLEYKIHLMIRQNIKKTIYCWNFIDGYYNNPNYLNKAIRNPLQAIEFIEQLNFPTSTIFFLKDFHVFINDISVIRKIKNLSRFLKQANSSIIISASEMQVPSLLKDFITVLEFPLPNYEEINLELHRLFKIMNVDSSIYSEYFHDLTLAYRGFSIEKIRISIAKLLTSNLSSTHLIKNILYEKRQLIEQTDVLEFYAVDYSFDNVGGLNVLKDWLNKRSKAFSKQAKNYGLTVPKGILLIGIQGTGKSLIAKAISGQWNLPLLKLDMGKIFASLVGQSEERMRHMIKTAEQSSPCILWIDEIDKCFTRLNNYTDSGTNGRVLSTMLTWLSEKKKPVFVIATANQVLSLPSELLRKGRFDEIFFLNLPSLEEREKIFQIHLMKFRPLSWRKYDIKYLSKLTDQFSGAEIEQAIIEAMYNAFYEKREFSTQDIINAINNFVPLAFTDTCNISAIQDWAISGKIRMAS
uniref:Uncharacterized AAA domain-containing protein ycf46 n=1 Tax=Gracilaria tenuistipitata var. liui TaxID=285951 RepID=YCF46_GRATL|nr:Ycf46 [Gracilaria tenuistipitata var. liui]Q6B952.1 RecName: Full=Uncharacterized AAA domain-containing protein ycf46 [Gracilaria tenuistipitata var. liui]AAT79583.1 conserved hypothetical plastid protein [Gracilaria tenuistipitata var. liui]